MNRTVVYVEKISWIRALCRRLKRVFRWRWFRGSFANWQDARLISTGYDEHTILQRVVEATREVVAGRAVWERDGKAFSDAVVNVPLLKVLALIKSQTGRLDVVDFGGGLGGTLRQHLASLGGGPGIRWRVVEQPHYVAAGREFTNEVLTFYDSILTASADGFSSVILLSSVLPYLEAPDDLLQQVVSQKFNHVIIDRTPLVKKGPTKLTVQFTPPELGGGSYPIWLFDRRRLLFKFQSDYDLVEEWPALDVLDPEVDHRGFYFRKKNP